MNIKHKKLVQYAKENNIEFIVLFGSHAENRSNSESDFDIAIYFKDGRPLFGSLRQYSNLLENLRNFLSINSDKIDLTDLRRANIFLRYEITSKGKLLYGNEEDFIQYKAFAFRDYIDGKKLFDLESFLIKKRQKFLANKIAAVKAGNL